MLGAHQGQHVAGYFWKQKSQVGFLTGVAGDVVQTRHLARWNSGGNASKTECFEMADTNSHPKSNALAAVVVWLTVFRVNESVSWDNGTLKQRRGEIYAVES